MCQALRELMKEEIAEEVMAAEQGGRITTLYGLYRDGDITLQKAAAKAGMSESAFLEAAKKIIEI